MTDDDLRDAVSRMILYFELAVLAPYRQEAHHYQVVTDNFDGECSIRSDYWECLSEEDQRAKNLDIHFGFRAKRDGTLAVAVWAPDICDRAGDEHRRKWAGFSVAAEQFPPEFDTRFSLWAQRTVGGSWDVEAGPLARLQTALAAINALAEEGVGTPLFKAEASSKLAFPSAENDVAYRDAHSGVYGLLIDGLDKGTISELAAKFGVSGRFDSDKTLTALKKIIVEPDLQSAILDPFDAVSRARRAADHGAQPAPSPLKAFDQFSRELDAVVVGLSKLRDYLAASLRLDVERCVARRQAKQGLLQLDPARRSEAHYSIVQVGSLVGKTISRVEYGFRKPRDGVHDSELMMLHCSDGSIFSVAIGSNAGNLSERHDGLRADDFHCSFILDFVPPAK